MADPVTMALMLGSAAVQATGTILQGNAGVAAARAEQGMLGAQAAEQVAVSTRDAQAKARETNLLLSNAQATAADSGGKFTDAGVVDIVGGIASEGNVQSREIMRQGQESANMTRYRGRLGVAAAKQNQKMSYLAAGGQLLSGAAGAFSAYGGNGPPGSAPSQQSSWWQFK